MNLALVSPPERNRKDDGVIHVFQVSIYSDLLIQILKPSRSLDSEIFTLKARGGQQFLAHGSILAAQSAPLRGIITGDWKESTERVIALEDWGGDTVGRFVEFLYLGNYQYPDPEPLHSSPTREVGGNVPVDLVLKDEELSQNRPLTPLGDCIPVSLRLEQKMDKETRLRQFSPLEHDYKEVLLAHSNVYALAQYKDVIALQSLSLENLLMTLMSIDQLEPRTHLAANVIALLGHVYSHTTVLVSSEEPMRRLVSQFAALNFPALQQTEGMEGLLYRESDLARDLMQKVCRRLVVSENELVDLKLELSTLNLEFSVLKVQLAELEQQSAKDKADLVQLKSWLSSRRL